MSFLFTSASDWASVQWRLMPPNRVTCSPDVNKYWATYVFIGTESHWPITVNMCGPSDDALIHGENARQGLKRQRKCPGILWMFKWTQKNIVNFDLWLKSLTSWSVILWRWYRVTTVHKCYAFNLKRKIVYRPPLVPVPRFWPQVYSLWPVNLYSMVRSGTVIGVSKCCGHNNPVPTFLWVYSSMPQSHFEIYLQTYDVFIKTKFINEHSACHWLYIKLTFCCGFLLSITCPFHLIFHCAEQSVLD